MTSVSRGGPEAKGGPARLDQAGPGVDDLAALDLDRGDLDEIGHPGIRARRLDVDHDELRARLGGLDEVEDRTGAGLPEGPALGLADLLLELLLDVDARLPGAMAALDRAGPGGPGG